MATSRRKFWIRLFALGALAVGVFFAWKRYMPQKDKYGNSWSLGKPYGKETNFFEVLRNGAYSGEAGSRPIRIENGLATVNNVRGGVSVWESNGWRPA